MDEVFDEVERAEARPARPRGRRAAMQAALRLAALAAFSARIGADEVADALRAALIDVRARAGKGASYLMRARLDS